jgi:hypothetical protein
MGLTVEVEPSEEPERCLMMYVLQKADSEMLDVVPDYTHGLESLNPSMSPLFFPGDSRTVVLSLPYSSTAPQTIPSATPHLKARLDSYST